MAQGNANIVAVVGPVTGQATVIVAATAMPTFSPAGGTYTSPQTVTISATTQSAVIYYTTDGSTPTTSSAVYSGGITVAANETLRAIAQVPGDSPSSVSSATYTVNSSPASMPTFSPVGGTYSSAQTVIIVTTTPSATIHYTTDGSTPSTNSAVYSGPITVTATETLKAVAVAASTSPSSMNSAAYTIAPAASAPTFSPAAGTYTSAQSISIRSTTPWAKIYYTTDGSTPTTSSAVYLAPITVAATETVRALAELSGGSPSSVSSADYTIAPPTAAPTFSPAPGTYTSAKTVTISTTTPSATIYYTTNGVYAVYTGPVTVAATETVKAIAVATGDTASSVSSAAYTINPVVAPTFSPAGGTYTSTQSISIRSTTPWAVIYYTTDGSTPTTSSAVYSGGITVAASKTLRAIAQVPGDSPSSVSSATYTFNSPPAAAIALTTFPMTTPVIAKASGAASLPTTRCQRLPSCGSDIPAEASLSPANETVPDNFGSALQNPRVGTESRRFELRRRFLEQDAIYEALPIGAAAILSRWG
jgi:hypothetical protein